MTPDRWLLLQELFNAAVDLPPEKQAAFPNEACGDDEALRHQAESLILATKQSTQKIQKAINGAAELTTRSNGFVSGG